METDKHVSNFSTYMVVNDFSVFTPPGRYVEPTEGMYKNNQGFDIQVKVTRNNLWWRIVTCISKLYSAANDPRPQMIPKLDRKWSRTANDPRCALQMIPLEYEEWHGVWFPGIFQFFILILIFTSFSSTKLLIRWT